MRSFQEYRIVRESSQKDDYETWSKWKSLVNLSRKDYSDTLSLLDLSEEERALSKTILGMLENASSFEASRDAWTTEMWKVCKDQVSYITRMRSMRKRMVGNPFERDGKMTKWLVSLLAKAHDPRKPLRKAN
jgi:hypothetical protein